MFVLCMYEYVHAHNVCLVSGDQKKEPNFMELEFMDGCKLSCGLESKPWSLIEALSALNYWAIFKYEISSWALAEAYTVCGQTHVIPLSLKSTSWYPSLVSLLLLLCQTHCNKSICEGPYLHSPTKKDD